MMDKSWMSKNRLSEEYFVGVESFIEFATKKYPNQDKLSCPCKECGNVKRQTVHHIRMHLLMHGIDQTYHTWIWHGEITAVDYSMEHPDPMHELGSEDLVEMVHAAYEKGSDDPCIAVYMWHLYKRLKKVDKFRFVNPYTVGHIPTRKIDEDESNKSIAKREKALIEGLLGTKVSQLVLVPCNVGYHWILTVIDPHNEEVGLMDPLHRENSNGDWQQIVDTALKTFVSTLGDAARVRKTPYWPSITAPKQPDYEQCGFYVMRYMKDIIESDSISTVSSLKQWFKNKKYSVHDIDEVRHEWATFVQEYIGE